jgi:hypothetical protein
MTAYPMAAWFETHGVAALLFRHGRASPRPSTSFLLKCSQDVDARRKAGHDEFHDKLAFH